MLASINKLAYERPPAFLTLTYPREYPDDPTVYRSHARAFLKRLRRRYGDRPIIWRLEFQQRGAPHFHMLVFDLASGPDVADELRECWYEVVDSQDSRHASHGIDLQAMGDWRRVAVYLSKYIAKPHDADGEILEPVGRWWGIESAAMLKIEPISFVASLAAGLKIRRAMYRAAGLKRRGDRENRGLTTFLTDDTAVRLVTYYGGRFERPIPTQPPEDPPPLLPGSEAYARWRSERRTWVAEHLAVGAART